MNITVGIVEPEQPENLGAIARVMANFGLSDLRILNPSFNILSEDVKRPAKHAQNVLEKARVFSSFEAMIQGFDTVIGTTGKRRGKVETIVPEEAMERVTEKTILLFGREGTGLSNKELQACDFVVTIPTSRKYPVLNLSHAVAILLYALKNRQHKKEERRISEAVELFSQLVSLTGFKDKEKAKEAFKNLLTSSLSNQREIDILTGVFSECKRRILH